MIARLCDIEHLIIIIVVLLVALLVVSAGKGGGRLLLRFLKKIIGIKGEDMAKPIPTPCAICAVTDPATCPLHQSEHERSLRNEKSISELWVHYGEMRKEMAAGFKDIQTSINTGQLSIMNTQVKILEAIDKRPKD